MRSLALAIAIAGAAVSPAFAETWHSLGLDDQLAQISVDRDALGRDGDLRIVRTRWEFPATDADGRKQLVATERYDCKRRVLSTREMLMTFKDGRVDRQAWNDDQWDEVLPRTTAEAVLDYVCAG